MTNDDAALDRITAGMDMLPEEPLEPSPPEPPPLSRHVSAGGAMLGAAQIRRDAHGLDPFADRCEAQARGKLPEAQVQRGAGGELVPMERYAEDACPVVIDTLEKPDYVAADASRERLDLLEQAGVLTSALDTADSIEAKDSLERMLAHQLATLHASTLKMAVQLNTSLRRLDSYGPNHAARATANVEACRLAGAMARLSTTYQAGLGTLQRVRSGGKQTFVFQHNHVTDGGQAVISGTVEGQTGEGRRVECRRGAKTRGRGRD